MAFIGVALVVTEESLDLDDKAMMNERNNDPFSYRTPLFYMIYPSGHRNTSMVSSR